jgi:hypothetical protein
LPIKVSEQHNGPEMRVSGIGEFDDSGKEQMKKLAVGLILAPISAGVYAQGAEVAGTTNVIAGDSTAGAGEALGAGALQTTNTALITAGVVSAGAVAAGSKTEST